MRLGDAQIHDVAGGHLAHKYNEVFDANQAFALGHHVLDFDVLKGGGRDRISEFGGFAGHNFWAVGAQSYDLVLRRW
ncbi:hypothetical protein GCM10027422_04230 [Hymenobacter arcticus]